VTGSFVDGYKYGLSGLRLLTRPGLRAFVLLPILLNAVVFAIGSWWLIGFLGRAQDAVTQWLPAWLDWLAWLIWPLAMIAVLVVVWTSFTLIANLLGSPFNGLLAEKVQRWQRPQDELPQLPLWQEVVRAPVAEVRKLIYFALLAIPVILVAAIPGLNILAPLAWAVYGAWLLAVEYCDYPLANCGLRLTEERRILRANRWLSLGFGAGVLTMTVIPGLNLVAMPSAVIGASLMWSDRLAESRRDV
jgi:CysZ protein